MKKFSRCVLIFIVVVVLAGVSGYFYEDETIIPMYQSTARLYVVPGEANEASIRATDGGLNNDFMIVFTSDVVISDVQQVLGTSEDIAKYLTISSPENSNIVEITCTNPDVNTAKSYADEVAKAAIRTNGIIPVESMQILSEATTSNTPIKPDLYRNTAIIAGAAGGICLVIEILVLLLISAFKKPKDNSDSEFEYERHYGKYAMLSEPSSTAMISEKKIDERSLATEKSTNRFQLNENIQGNQDDEEEMKDILADFDEEDSFGEEDLDEESDQLDAAFAYVAASAERNTFQQERLEEIETDENESEKTQTEESESEEAGLEEIEQEDPQQEEIEQEDIEQEVIQQEEIEQEQTQPEEMQQDDLEGDQKTDFILEQQSLQQNEEQLQPDTEEKTYQSSAKILGTIKK